MCKLVKRIIQHVVADKGGGRSGRWQSRFTEITQVSALWTTTADPHVTKSVLPGTRSHEDFGLRLQGFEDLNPYP